MKTFKTLRALYSVLADQHNVKSLITTSNPKVEKNAKNSGIAGACLHLSPGFAVWVCAFAGLCRKLCLDKSGNPQHKSGKEKARHYRTALYQNDRQLFLFALVVEIAKWRDSTKKKGFKKFSFRLNATSDILFEKVGLTITPEFKPLLAQYGIRCAIGKTYTVFQLFPTIVFYDYSKIAARFNRSLPQNYSLTFSLDGSNNVDSAIEILNRGGTVAVPFYKMPERFTLVSSSGRSFTYPVFNGDNSDYRPTDPSAHIIGLKYKRVSNGESNDNNGFIIERGSQSIAQNKQRIIVRAA